MYQLTYISTARPGVTDADVDNILARSRRNNGRDQITGLLIHDGRRFLQVLEGPQPLVDAALRGSRRTSGIARRCFFRRRRLPSGSSACGRWPVSVSARP